MERITKKAYDFLVAALFFIAYVGIPIVIAIGLRI